MVSGSCDLIRLVLCVRLARVEAISTGICRGNRSSSLCTFTRILLIILERNKNPAKLRVTRTNV